MIYLSRPTVLPDTPGLENWLSCGDAAMTLLTRLVPTGAAPHDTAGHPAPYSKEPKPFRLVAGVHPELSSPTRPKIPRTHRRC